MITGNKIRTIRQLKHIPIKDMASRLEMDESTYSRLERNETKLTEERVDKILHILNISRESVEQFDNKINYLKTFNDNSNSNIINNQQNQNIGEELIKNQNKIFQLIERQITQTSAFQNELLKLIKDKKDN